MTADPRAPDDPARQLDDELLAIRCQLGEPAAFDALVARWHPPVWAFVRRLMGDDDQAAEVTQDVWIRVLRGIGRLRDPARLRAWLFAVARHAVMDRLRERYSAPARSDVDPADLPDDAAPRDVEGEHEALVEELEGLPVVEREVLALFYLRELSLQQLAEVLAVPVGTVKSRLHRARRLLRSRVEARGVHP